MAARFYRRILLTRALLRLVWPASRLTRTPFARRRWKRLIHQRDVTILWILMILRERPRGRQIPNLLTWHRWENTLNIVIKCYWVTGSPLVLVRYSIYQSIAILVNVRYRYLMISSIYRMIRRYLDDISYDPEYRPIRYSNNRRYWGIARKPRYHDTYYPGTDSSIINTSD